jgi:5-methylcytosine-specific restriction protein A
MTARNLNPAQTLHWSRWYGLQLWFRIRAHQLRKEPLCVLCLKAGRTTPATVADHIEPHGGDWNKFRTGHLQSLCQDCHRPKWASDRKGYRDDIGDDGYPLDPAHPFNAASKAQKVRGRGR